jgi:hypothetical protein
MRESDGRERVPDTVMLPVCTSHGPIADLESVGKISIVCKNVWISLKTHTMKLSEWGVSEKFKQSNSIISLAKLAPLTIYDWLGGNWLSLHIS